MEKIVKSSGNVFADLGIADADTHKTKAQLVHRISKLIERQGLSQSNAAKLLGMSQPDVSKMLRGQFNSMTIDRLVKCILELGGNVNISLPMQKGAKRQARPVRGKLTVVAA